MLIHTDYETAVLRQVSVGEMLDHELPTTSSDVSVGELAEKNCLRDPLVSKHEGLSILDATGNLEGVITRSDILRAFEKDSGHTMSALGAWSRAVVVTYPDELPHVAAAKMLRHNIGRLPVVERSEPARAVGYLGRQGIMAAPHAGRRARSRIGLGESVLQTTSVP